MERDETYMVYHRFKIPGGDGTHRVCRHARGRAGDDTRRHRAAAETEK